jgi:hypothetical protein
MYKRGRAVHHTVPNNYHFQNTPQRGNSVYMHLGVPMSNLGQLTGYSGLRISAVRLQTNVGILRETDHDFFLPSPYLLIINDHLRFNLTLNKPVVLKPAIK